MHTYFDHYTMHFVLLSGWYFQVRTFAYTVVGRYTYWVVSNTTKQLLTGYVSGYVECNFIFDLRSFDLIFVDK